MSTGLDHLDAADILLGGRLSRSALLTAPKLTASRVLKLRIDRTMPFEFVGRWLPVFCSLWGASVSCTYSDYDAALTGIGGTEPQDSYLLWLDWRIYTGSMEPKEAAGWLTERIRKLRQQTERTIWVNNWPETSPADERLFSFRTRDSERFRALNDHLTAAVAGQPGCELIDLRMLSRESETFFDPRNESASNYPFSGEATLNIARHIGVHLLPSALQPRLKALALDLDDTLYRGVLGEDGADGVVLTEGHAALQRLLSRLRESGMLLTICSRNEEADVRELFEHRADFPLRWTDFAATAANWRSKPDNLNELARQLNIDPSAILFIDDNPAELLKMAAHQPDVRLLRAESEGGQTLDKLAYYPGLYQLRPDGEAASRTTDIKANQQRELMRQGAKDQLSYLASLKMVVRLHVNERAHAARLYDMSQKTNQFNLALRRITEQEALEMMDPGRYITVTAALSDQLSDSGIIGALVCRIGDREARLVETVFSCRALGRGVESLVLARTLELLAAREVKWLIIDSCEGPRNAPARAWASSLGQAAGGKYEVKKLQRVVKKLNDRHPAKVEVVQ
ncbi:HAD-IIIC family phosphatase [Paenibacillus sp. 1P07SE]|uniref:HAD-IIIC family phosphatase n=1 Tax=Paenibacillus sp. 1P07SE TaxID=3132209 RepID=UPI0039A5E8E4